MAKNNKTIGISIRFFTNDLPQRVGSGDKYIPCWATGGVYIEANKEKGITSKSHANFNGMHELPEAIRRAMVAAKIVTVTGHYLK